MRTAWAMGVLLVGLAVGCGRPDADRELGALGLPSADSTHLAALLGHYEPPGRDRWQQPELVVRALRLPRGATVVELGATTGYFTQALAQSPAVGRLIAVEPEPLLRRLVAERAPDAELHAAALEAPGLPPALAHCIVVADGLGRLPDAPAAWRALMPLLRPGGQLVLVAARPATPAADSTARPVAHWLERLQAAGYRAFALDSTLLPYHVLITAE